MKPLSRNELERVRRTLRLPDASGLCTIDRGGFVSTSVMLQGSPEDVELASQAVQGRLLATVDAAQRHFDDRKILLEQLDDAQRAAKLAVEERDILRMQVDGAIRAAIGMGGSTVPSYGDTALPRVAKERDDAIKQAGVASERVDEILMFARSLGAAFDGELEGLLWVKAAIQSAINTRNLPRSAGPASDTLDERSDNTASQKRVNMDEPKKSILEQIKELAERKAALEDECSGTQNWWMCQLHKHRPDLDEKLQRDYAELTVLNKEIRSLQKNGVVQALLTEAKS